MSPSGFLATARRGLFNLLAVTVPALVLLVAVLEVGVRLVAPVSDVPDVRFAEPLGNRFAPAQTGVSVRGGGAEIRAEYRINEQGWNSPHEYDATKPQGVTRIAVVGDSFVEAFQVDYDASFPYLLERRLNAAGVGGPFQVFSYGHSGANLAQYVEIVRHSVVPASPDLVIVTVVHNDFQEALAGFSRVDNWSLERRDDGWRALPPRPQENLALKRLLRHSALARFAIYNLSLHQRLFFLRAMFQGRLRRFEANIDVEIPVLSDPELLAGMLDHVVGELAALAESHGFDLLLVMDGHRQPIYAGEDPRSSTPQRLNEALAAAAGRRGVPLLDLTSAFESAWQRDGERFEFEIDHHWNALGHQVAAEALAGRLLAREEV